MMNMQYARKTRIANPDEAGEATILQTGLAVCRSMHEELEIRLQPVKGLGMGGCGFEEDKDKDKDKDKEPLVWPLCSRPGSLDSWSPDPTTAGWMIRWQVDRVWQPGVYEHKAPKDTARECGVVKFTRRFSTFSGGDGKRRWTTSA
ncbi:hypothetical protein CTAM01_13899 [Colletotrichum tamarilloi]|uniref:Uncharacterized protein n=1 Tax=Colletotrichum tamarilloi TaxID=1209934 RepID=A0ABQ9QQM5_9PEZI|nr:uncharacterized protein CTAM01_13899 [Colletotrichum tamarilloi]KAK1481651.1 hypothetical protein CTAM01_13899 [Colletotrichum tamarilloi]